MDSPPRRLCFFWIALAALVAGGASLAYPRTLLDSPLSTYIGNVMLEGGAPYRDAWDPRAPGIFFAYALQIFLFGKSAIALRAFDLLWQLATALVLASVGTRIYRRNAVGLIAGVAYLVAYYSQNFWHWAEPDTFLSLPLALSLLFTLRGMERRRVLDWGVAAFFVGIATLFKLPYGLFGILLLIAVVRDTRGQGRRTIANLMALAAGFAAPLLAGVLYFSAKGALQDFVTTEFVFAPAYVTRIHRLLGLPDFLNSALRPVLIPFYLMALVGLGALAIRLRRNNRLREGEALLAGWLAVGVVAFFLHGSFLGYHYLALFAPAAVLFASVISHLRDPHPEKRRWHGRVALLLILLFLIVPTRQFARHTAFARRILNGYKPDAPWRELGDYIKQRTSPSERIFVWGNVPLVYLYADREAASRFLCTAYLSLTSPNLDYRSVAMNELRSNPPTYFVLFKEGSITPALPDSLESFLEFRALRDWIEAEYAVELDRDLYVLFRRRK